MYYSICELKSDHLENWNVSWEKRWEKLLYQKGSQCLYSVTKNFGFKAPYFLLQLLCLPFSTNVLVHYVYFNFALQICVFIFYLMYLPNLLFVIFFRQQVSQFPLYCYEQTTNTKTAYKRKSLLELTLPEGEFMTIELKNMAADEQAWCWRNS